MEHRWGQRLAVDRVVRFEAPPQAPTTGRLRDVSLSGAYVEGVPCKLGYGSCDRRNGFSDSGQLDALSLQSVGQLRVIPGHRAYRPEGPVLRVQPLFQALTYRMSDLPLAPVIRRARRYGSLSS